MSSGDKLGGHHELETIRQRQQAAALPNVGDAQVIVRADDFVRQPQLADQIHGCGLHGKEAIGAALDDAAFDTLCLDDATEPWPGFKQCGGNAGLSQVKRGG